MPERQPESTVAVDKEQDSQALREQRRLIRALLEPACHAHPVVDIRVIETHISFVILTGAYAYKIKKSVDLGFLDFTTLANRRFYCEEELRLNARLAPELYLEVVQIGGTADAPKVGGSGTAIEYAVKMREFPQQAQLDRALARGALSTRHVDALAARIAAFHFDAPRASLEPDAFRADKYARHGTPEAIGAAAAQNFEQMRAVGIATNCRSLIDDVEAWSQKAHQRLKQVFHNRRRDGWVRECHGDLHLRNIVLLDDEPRAFDCIEFEPEFRWIDVMSDIAFLIMDLHAADRAGFAARFLNAYLESTGDYGGLQVLRYYLVYRAMVRAKISLLRAAQLAAGSAEARVSQQQARRYLELAAGYARPRGRFVAITHGFSGSGKTTLSQALLELSGAIRVRSDVERKRLHSLAPTQRGRGAIDEGLYRSAATDATYQRLRELAQIIVDAGHGVIVDATFLKRAQRDIFRVLAERAGTPFAIVDFVVNECVLRDRVAARSRQGDDASDADMAVLEHQLQTHQPLQADELDFIFQYDASRPTTQAQQASTWSPLLQRLTVPFDDTGVIPPPVTD